MKRILSLVMALLLLSLPVLAEVDLKTIGDDELIKLYTDTAEELRNRGKYPYMELSNGASGNEVTLLQSRLVELGYLSKEPSGKYDGNTASAMKAFEKVAGFKQDGKASISEQQSLFSKSAPAKPTPTPKPTPRPTPTKKPTPTPDPRKAYGKLNYAALARNPEAYKNQKMKISGTVVQVLGDKNNGFEMRVATKGRYDDLVYIVTTGKHAENILEKDKINFYCVMLGDYTYETVMGASVTLPLAMAEFYEFR